jgi:hypothetical protein
MWVNINIKILDHFTNISNSGYVNTCDIRYKTGGTPSNHISKIFKIGTLEFLK